MIKKIIIIIITACTLFCSSCNHQEDEVIVYAVDGAPALSMIKLMDKSNVEGKNIKVKVVSNIDNLIAGITNNSANLAIAPINNVANLYNKGIDYSLISVNVFGCLYMINSLGIQEVTLDEIRGKTVYVVGQGGSPDITFRYLLDKKGIKYTSNLETKSENVNIIYEKEAQTIISRIAQDKTNDISSFAILGEPAISQAVNKLKVSICFDFKKEWEEITKTRYTQAGVIVNNKFYNKNQKFTKEILKIMSLNNQYLNDNIDKVKELMIKNGSNINIDITPDIIKRLNLDCKSIIEIKSDVRNFLSIINDYNSKLIGEKLPDDNLYLEV